MREDDYIYAVARIRCRETALLDSADISQLIEARNFADALRKLGELGYDTSSEDIGAILNGEMERAWELITEIAPDREELAVFAIRNAFHNLKTALKHRVSAAQGKPFYLSPSAVDIELIDDAVNTNRFELLPDYMRDCAAKCYAALTNESDGQTGEAIIDRQSLAVFCDFAKRTHCEGLIKAANLIVATSDIKIAFRAAATGKQAGFLRASLCECEGLDIDKLTLAACNGIEAVAEYVKTTEFSQAGALILKSSVDFEKWCDDSVLACVSGGKTEAFGFLPLAGYYLAKETEIKNVRIIMSAKENELPASRIEERLRMLYV